MQNHPYKIQITCAIFIVSVRPRLLFDPLKNSLNLWWHQNKSFLGDICPNIFKSSNIWLKANNLPLTSRLMSYMVQKKKKVLCVHWLVSLAQAVTTVSHSMFLFPHFGTPPHRWSCMWVGELTALLAKLPFWLDIVWTLTQCREFCVHLTSLINKSSVAK